MNKITIKINARDVEARAGATILEVARCVNINIPTLCFFKDLNQGGSCRMCVVEVKGAKTLLPACVTKVTPGMEIYTDTEVVIESRRKTLDLICSNHRMDCEPCSRYSNCELHALVREYELDDRKYSYVGKETVEDTSAVHLVRDQSKCTLCRRCVSACQNRQSVGAIDVIGRGLETKIGNTLPLAETNCVHCGQCISVCPTGALSIKDETHWVWKALNDPKTAVVALLSPEVGAQLGEAFHQTIGTNVDGKTIAILRRLGFDRVFDMGSAAAITAKEVGKELLARIETGEGLPLFSSDCPSWVTYCEQNYAEFVDHLSTKKSPKAMFGALYKNCLVKDDMADEKNVFVVSIKSCTASKFETSRPSLVTDGIPDVDVSLTTRELESMIKRACVSRFTANKVWKELAEGQFDTITGISSGYVYDAVGGVMGAVMETLSAKPVDSIQRKIGIVDEVISERVYDLGGKLVRGAIVSGLGNAAKLMDQIRTGKKYDYVEIMGCPGGCINGGGQPNQSAEVHNFTNLKKERIKGLITANRISEKSLPDTQQFCHKYLEGQNSNQNLIQDPLRKK